MTLPFGFKELSPEDLRCFRKLYEDSVSAQPMDELGEWFVRTYNRLEAGESTEALARLDFVFEESSDYVGFVAAKLLLSQVGPCSAVSYQVAKRLLASPSPLLFRYALCLVIAGEVLIDGDIREAVARLSSADEETMGLAMVAKLAIQTGVAPHV